MLCRLGSVSVDGKTIDSFRWQHFSVDFSTEFLTAVKHSTHWTPTVRHITSAGGHSHSAEAQPTLYRGHFRAKQSRDTYIDMSHWTKGLVIINGFVLGRYWNIGPQQSLYVPSPILSSHGWNNIMVFELERTLNAKVKLVAKPVSEHRRHRG